LREGNYRSLLDSMQPSTGKLIAKTSRGVSYSSSNLPGSLRCLPTIETSSQ
jgi:hypothetical protein